MVLKRFFKNLFDLGGMAFPQNIALGADDEGGGNAANAPFDADVVFPDFSVEILRPGEALFLGRFDHGTFVRIKTDADETNAFGLILIVEADHVIRLVHARAAPGGPEIDDHDLAAQIGEADGGAIDGVEGELRLVADFDGGEGNFSN